MGPGETIALIAIVGGFIAVTITVTTIFKRIMSFQEQKLALKAGGTSVDVAPYVAKVEQLEARVRVLERIATDQGTMLAQQIEDLRSPLADTQFAAEERA